MLVLELELELVLVLVLVLELVLKLEYSDTSKRRFRVTIPTPILPPPTNCCRILPHPVGRGDRLLPPKKSRGVGQRRRWMHKVVSRNRGSRFTRTATPRSDPFGRPLQRGIDRTESPQLRLFRKLRAGGEKGWSARSLRRWISELPP